MASETIDLVKQNTESLGNSNADGLHFLGEHPLAELARYLGNYLGIGTDALSLTMLLSRIAGRLRQPFNLAIYSDDVGAEHLIADRLVQLLPETVRRTDTIKQFRELSNTGFKDAELVIVRSLHEVLFRFACETACKDISAASAPSLWLITDERSSIAPIGPTLPLMARQMDRSLVGFGHQFSTASRHPIHGTLRQLLLQLKNRVPCSCPFQNQIKADLKPHEMLVVNRLLQTVAAVRIELSYLQGNLPTDDRVTIGDYDIIRNLLNKLPVPGDHSSLSPYAAETGCLLYDAVNDQSYQLTIPDHSSFGSKAFTRRFAEEATGFSYNTVKDHIRHLEDDGILESLVITSQQRCSRVRGPGRQIYFRFAKSRSPPFGTKSPFERLPATNEIAADCRQPVQS
jgi:hypothetical protein